MKKTFASLVDIDILEKFVLLIIFAFFTVRMFIAMFNDGSIINYIYFFDQLLVLIFILLRRKALDIAQSPLDWIIGLAGTFLPLLISPIGDMNIISTKIAAFIMLVGIALHLSAKLVLRRSFGVVAANRGVKVQGPYRMVRHPMYAGYIILQLGFLLGGPNLQNLVIILTCWILFILRIAAEERLLRQDPDYKAFLTRVRFRLIPGIY